MRVLEKLRRKFIKEENIAVKQWVSDLKPSTCSKGTILITALRNKTWIEWAVYSACVIRQMGYKPILLYNENEINFFYGSQSFFWSKAKEISDIQFVNFENYSPDHDLKRQYSTDTPLFIYDAIAYDYHIERENVITSINNYHKDIEILIEQSTKASSALTELINTINIDSFICYSGLIGISPTLLNTAKKCKLNTVCIEGWSWRKGHVLYNFNNPALEYNIKGWSTYYGWGEEQKKTIEEYLNFQEGNAQEEKEWLKDFHNVQLVDKNTALSDKVKQFIKKYPQSFILAPNVIGDSSTLNRETIFNGQQSWIKEIIEFFKNNQHLSLIIRAHPAEVWVSAKISIHLGKFASELADGIDNILVIDGGEKINTFALIPYLKGGLVWLSSIGVDLVVRNVPVICAASPKYKEMGIVEEPVSKKEYFEKVLGLAKIENKGTTDFQKQEAKKYLYTVFKGFSFPAQGVTYEAATLRLNDMPEQAEHDRFFKIITGEIPAPDELYKEA